MSKSLLHMFGHIIEYLSIFKYILTNSLFRDSASILNANFCTYLYIASAI